MTVTSTNQKVQFNGNGSTTVFAYNFKIFASSDLSVILRSAAGTETVQQLTTNYTVSGVGEASGGNVTMGTAPASGATLTILRVQPNLQGLDLVPNDPFPAGSMEDALDKLTFMVQTHDEEIGRSIKASRTNTIGDTEFTTSATDRANKLFSFDGSGDLQISQELGTYKGNWAASTTYAVRDLVKDTSTNNIFIAVTAHTSSGSQPLTTNTDSAKWALIVDAASATTSATAAASSATAAASSATASASSASTSSTKADEAAASASTASTKAGEAATSATASASSATAAASSATAAASSATSAAASAADVAKVQGITNGTVSASKAMVVDANKDISGARNLTVTGALSATTSMTVQNGSGTEGVRLDYNENGGEIVLLGTSGNNKLLIDYLDSDNDGNGLGRILNLGAGSTGVQIGIANASNTGGITFSTGNNVTRQQISAIGDISTYATDGSTVGMFWDASAKSLTMPAQPAFLARPASSQDNIAVTSLVTVVFGTEIFDQNANFASNTFTAPVTGKYQFSASVKIDNLDSAAAYYAVYLVTSNRGYVTFIDPDFGQDAAFFSINVSVLADLDASDTAFIRIVQNGGTAQSDIQVDSHFSGYLVA